ncbi:hypothetical protein DPMN_067915 [Dreissena polymorpha]|uniref:Uncharacterized protein n=1 Tax=Dreissena polymorpha TaxID=45954 RepID=A0A9D3YWM3_DREPO|nr:hypothetical protein DPMN_067915 [Dreissena polymorpha]
MKHVSLTQYNVSGAGNPDFTNPRISIFQSGNLIAFELNTDPVNPFKRSVCKAQHFRPSPICHKLQMFFLIVFNCEIVPSTRRSSKDTHISLEY